MRIRSLKPALALSLAAFAGTVAAGGNVIPTGDVEKGRAAATTCLACHTADGSRGLPTNPILAGQFPEYLAKQLHDFKASKRANAIMQGMAAILSDEDIANVSAFYASLPHVSGAASNPETVLMGERIWRGGIAGRNIPACAGCHGATGGGIPSQYPVLAGQHAEYIKSSLIAYRSGERANNAVMMGIAARMNDREIAAVSDYIAGLQPVPQP